MHRCESYKKKKKKKREIYVYLHDFVNVWNLNVCTRVLKTLAHLFCIT